MLRQFGGWLTALMKALQIQGKEVMLREWNRLMANG
jgi:hypothetical protein